jgi:NMD protein affecting ribosome stability and mRNA decay
MKLRFRKLKYCQNCGVQEVSNSQSLCGYCGFKLLDIDFKKTIVLHKKEKPW